MKYILVLIVTCQSILAFGQSDPGSESRSCPLSLVRLTFEDNVAVGRSRSSVKLLSLAKSTNDTLVSNLDIEEVRVRTDSFCCTYIGYTYATSLLLLLSDKGVNALQEGKVFRSSGIPVALISNGREVLRAYIVGDDTSYTTKNIAIVWKGKELCIVNEFPRSADHFNWDLIRRLKTLKCLPKTMYN